MEYLSIEEAKSMTGLRLVLTKGVPGPWSEAAKAVLNLRGVHFIAVEQKGGGRNPDLIEWTRHRNAPVALYNDEAPRVRWLEILDLAERLGSGPSLIPSDTDDRITMIGLANEIAGENGFAWNARQLMLHAGAVAQPEAIAKNPMYADYLYDEKIIASKIAAVEQFLSYLTQRIDVQRNAGSAYLIGNSLTAADVYWAYFSNMLQSLPAEKNPMPNRLPQSWAVLAKTISGYDPTLIAHRDNIFNEHLELPLSF